MEQRDRAAARGRGQAHQRMSARGEAGRSARIPLSRHATRASDGIRRTSIASPSFASRMTCSTWMRALSHFLPRMRSATSRRSFFSRFLRLFSCRRRGCRSTRRCAWGRGARLAARAAESPRRRRCALVRLSFAREENAGAAPIEGPMHMYQPCTPAFQCIQVKLKGLLRGGLLRGRSVEVKNCDSLSFPNERHRQKSNLELNTLASHRQVRF